MRPVRCAICNKEFLSPKEFDSFNCGHKDHDFSDVLDQFDYNQGEQHTIAVVGPPESGKSYYIYTLLYNLMDNPSSVQRAYLDKLNIEVEIIGKRSYQQYEDFKKRLLSSRLNFTNPEDVQNNIPLLLKLKIGNQSNKQIKLCFFDISGEIFKGKLEDAENYMEEEARIFKAKGIIYLQDPFMDMGLNRLLVNGSQESFPEDFQILERLHKAIISKAVRRQGAKVATPLAFCLSMFDLLEHHVPDIIAPNPYLEINDLIKRSGELNQRVLRNKSKELELFIQEKGTIRLANLRNRFLKREIFAISSTGHDDLDNVGVKGLKPRGILAPLLWILAENGFIEKY